LRETEKTDDWDIRPTFRKEVLTGLRPRRAIEKDWGEGDAAKSVRKTAVAALIEWIVVLIPGEGDEDFDERSTP